MTVYEAILARRSVRKFSNRPIEEAILFELLEAARHAPSGGNGQDHLFGVVRDKSIIRALSKAAGNQDWIMTAPVVFACCARLPRDFRTLSQDDFGLLVNKTRFGQRFLDYLMAYDNWPEAACLFANAAPLIPAQHMVLTGVSHGLSACFVGYLDVQAASRILNLPEDIICLFLLPMGYPDEPPQEKYIKPLSDISFHDRFEG